ncbi:MULTISPECIES: energy-coupling factor transporter transmembrane component T family protein [Paenibacillus]|uniref:Cobalt ABC transporter permease n=1 Tax=Paenibacillus vini TaxID=1476024 RepID=A0ABQ4MGH5_9BACL|nr:MULTISPECIES: energy-coupling factor transporter transmembrane component T [Paenibacillus]MBQ4900660.1 energy-coupling factor transporter transmembrane protein EcfT [Paenibacillus sp. Marseille-P2973]MDN4067901.1 energy-coupling factor transporter transmembrane component T [Paenibacillus vini]GIP55080.1 cobalt ABC transporter permease [Paenibacillus vini]
MKKWLNPSFTTWMHRANPVLKLVLVILLFFVALFTHRLDFMFYQAVMFTLLLFWQSGYAFWKVLLIVLSFGLVFISSSSTMILFGKGDEMWWEWGLIRITEESFYRGIHIGFKSVTFASEGLLFVLTTSSVDLFYALMQKVKLPPKYAYSFMASIRLLPMVWEEFLIRRNALRIRGARSLKGPRGWFAGIKMYAVPLLSQSIRRAHRVAVAMEAKAFNGNGRRSYYYPSLFTRYDPLAAAVFAAAVVLALMLSDVFPLFHIADVRYSANP